MVVFPAASKPTIRILISFFPHILSNSFENDKPILAVWRGKVERGKAFELEDRRISQRSSRRANVGLTGLAEEETRG